MTHSIGPIGHAWPAGDLVVVYDHDDDQDWVRIIEPLRGGNILDLDSILDLQPAEAASLTTGLRDALSPAGPAACPDPVAARLLADEVSDTLGHAISTDRVWPVTSYFGPLAVAVDRGRVKVVAPQGQGVLLNLRSHEAQELASVLAEATSPLLMRATMRATQRDRIIDYLCGGIDTSVLAVGCPDCQARPGQPCPTRGLLCNGRVAAIIGLAPPDPDADNEPDELLAAPAVSPRSALAVLPTLVIEAAKVLAARILGGAR